VNGMLLLDDGNESEKLRKLKKRMDVVVRRGKAKWPSQVYMN
jgi:hypothetical protein